MLYTPWDWEAEERLNDPYYFYRKPGEEQDMDLELDPMEELYEDWELEQAEEEECLRDLYEEWLAMVWPVR